MKAACTNKRDALNSYFKTFPSAGAELTIAQNLRLVAKTFVAMHELREEADYDYSTHWARTDVVPQVASVAAASKPGKRLETRLLPRIFSLLSSRRNVDKSASHLRHFPATC
jgi:hypothetical protein